LWATEIMNTTLAVLGLSGTELVLVLVAILILFGAKRIPEFAKGLGKGINEFKKASREVTDEIERAGEAPPPSPKAPVTSPDPQTAQTSSAPKA
jgi:sec-independent protein translocase protein TatA